jgi:DNA polymerase-3 subunit delta
MSFSLEKDILGHKATLIHSKDPFRVAVATNVIAKELKGRDDYEFNYERLEANSPELGEALERVKMLPLGAERRVLLLTGCESIGKDNVSRLKAYLQTAPQTSTVVLLGVEVKPGSQIYKLIASQGKVIELEEYPKRKYPSIIKGVFAEKGKKVSNQVVQYLLDCLGYDLAAIHSTVEKIILCHEGKESLDLEDVINLVPVTVEYRIFELVDQLAIRDINRSLKMLEAMLNQSVSRYDEDEKAAWVFSMILRQFRMLIRYRSMAQSGLGNEEIAGSLEIKPFLLEKVREQSRRFEMDELEDVFQKLLSYDLAAKASPVSTRCSLELLFYDICAG